MKRTKRIASLIIAAALLTSMMASCGKTNGSSSDTGNKGEEEKSSSVKSSSEVTQEIDVYKKYDPPIELTQGMLAMDDVFPEGRSIENNAYTDWCKEEVGIIWKAKWVAPDGEVFAQKTNLAMASNDLPDVMAINKSNVMKLAKGGQILELDNYMEKYNSDLVKFVMQEANDVELGSFYTPYKYDGKVYGVPSYAHTVNPSFNWYRKDILDTIGMKAPGTIDELSEVLAAFKKQYPDKIGFVLAKDGTTPLVMDAYNAFPKLWREKDGKLEYGAVQPEVKNALAKLREYYEAGYIDKEFVVSDVEAKWAAGNILMRSEMWWLNWGANLQLVQNAPETEMSVFPYLQGPDGFVGREMLSGTSNEGNVISTKCKNPEALFILKNWYTDSAYRNDEEVRSKFEFKYAAEPNQVAINQAEFDQMVADGVKIERARAARTFNYVQQGPDQGDTEGFFNEFIDHGYRQGMKVYQRATALRDALLNGFNVMKDGGDKNSLTPYELTLYNQTYDSWGEMLCLAMREGQIIAAESEDKEVRNQFMGAPTPTMTEKQAYLDKITSEAYVKIIMGDASIESFDKFVEEWKKNGGDKITEEVNEWYAQSK